MLKVQEFIRNHNDWEQLLSQSPYCLKVSRDNVCGKDLIGLKYNQIDSDFSNEIVRECRGLILSESDNYEVVTVPFFKFGNYGESYVAPIDWSNAKITQKIDGSLIKIVRIGDELLISTNGTIDASKAEVSQTFACSYANYRQLVLAAEPLCNMSNDDILALFEEGYTYMFELTSIYNKVVIPYDGIKLWFIGCRDNQSLQEILIYNHPLSKVFDTPKQYGFKSLQECIDSAKLLPYNDEGYVVVDNAFNRCKVKSAAYVAIHHLKGEGILTPKKALELIRMNEVVEFLNYFNEYRANFEQLGNQYESLINDIQNDWDNHRQIIDSYDLRKDKAMYIKDHCKYISFAFGMLDGKFSNSRIYVANLHPDNVLKMIEQLE